jgi:tetratricopeptide (TPR) repeat protein
MSIAESLGAMLRRTTNLAKEARMRNDQPRTTQYSIRFFTLIMTALLLAGCNSLPRQQKIQQKQTLEAAFAALNTRNYPQASARADEYLRVDSRSREAAEAFYVKGRASEGIALGQPPREARAQFLAARDAYHSALRLGPSQPLDSRIRAGLANVSYWMDDYGTALEEWKRAYAGLEDADTRAFTLYRIGLCQQRLGRFEDADRSFERVQQEFAASEAAQRAREHQGARNFTLQLATFNNASAADAAVAKLKRDVQQPSTTKDARGNTVVMIGPIASYPQASALKDRYAVQFPYAVVVP